jgi:hypothetical protein
MLLSSDAVEFGAVLAIVPELRGTGYPAWELGSLEAAKTELWSPPTAAREELGLLGATKGELGSLDATNGELWLLDAAKGEFWLLGPA